MDDSGSRDPDKHPKPESQEPNWFALGGVLIDAADKDACDSAIVKFRESWPSIGESPLHSYEIRNKSLGFRWLNTLPEEELNRFYSEISDLVTSLPIIVAGCVVHRPGYNNKYMQQYGQRRWKLCRTAFSIAVERAAKYAAHHQGRLRVFVERTDKKTEAQFRGYYDHLKESGPPFDEGRSSKYSPLQSDALASTLYEFAVKTKKSDLMQLADLCLWPICTGGYNHANKAYAVLQKAGKLLDHHCTQDNGLLGIKYSCFDA